MSDRPFVPHSGNPQSPTRPNKWNATRNAWFEHNVDEPTYFKSLEASPAVCYVINAPQRPSASRVTSLEVYPTKDGYGLLPYPGKWWIYWVEPSSSVGIESYVTYPATNLLVVPTLFDLAGFIRNIDIKKWGGSELAAARDADADADFAAADKGGLVNARTAYLNTGGDWVRDEGSPVSGADGLGHAAFKGRYGLSALFARETAGNTMQPVEALLAALGVSQMRDSAFWSSRKDRRFLISGEGTAIAFTNGFTATIPQFIMVAGATKEFVVRRIKISLSIVPGTPPGLFRVVLDTANRYSSGGTSRTPFNMNGGGAGATGLAQVRDGAAAITATAAGGGTREMGTTVLKTLVGEPYIREFEDGLIVGQGASLLFYCYAGDTAGRFHYEIEGEETSVQ